MSDTNWNGVFSVLMTPFTPDGSLDLERFGTLIDASVGDGASGVVVAASTGEFNALEAGERLQLFEAAVDAVGDAEITLLAGVTALNVEESYQYAAAARTAGFGGVLALPPLYALPNGREIERFYRDLVDRGGLPVMAYNGPRRTGVNMTANVIDAISDIDGVVALKESSGSIKQLAQAVHVAGDRIKIFTGHEVMIIPATAVGATGVISMSTQILGRSVVDFFDQARAGDLDAARQFEPLIYGLYETFGIGNYYSAMKLDMELLGRSVGPTRPPLLPLTSPERNEVRTLLQKHDFLGPESP